MVKNPPGNARDRGCIPGPGSSHRLESKLLSPHTTTIGPHMPVL